MGDRGPLHSRLNPRGRIAACAVLLVGWLVPPVGLVLALTLLTTAILAPAAAGAVSRRAEASLAPARADLADAAVGDRTLIVLTHRPDLFPVDAWERGPELLPAAAA